MSIYERYRKVRVPALSGLEQVRARLKAAERRRAAQTAQQVAAGQLLLHDPEVRLAMGPEQEAEAYERLNDLEASIGLPPTPYTDVPKQEFAKQIHAGQVTVAERALPAGEREALLDDLTDATVARFGTARVARHLVDQRNQQTLARAAMSQGQGKPGPEATESPMGARQWVRSLIEPHAPAAVEAAPAQAQQVEGPARSAALRQRPQPIAATEPAVPATAATVSKPAMSMPPTVRPVAPPMAGAPAPGSVGVTLTSAPSGGTAKVPRRRRARGRRAPSGPEPGGHAPRPASRPAAPGAPGAGPAGGKPLSGAQRKAMAAAVGAMASAAVTAAVGAVAGPPAAVAAGKAAGAAARAGARARPGHTFPPDVEQWRATVAKYFPADQVDNALRVMQAESGGDPSKHNGNAATKDDSWGLFQINRFGKLADSRPPAEQLLDADFNIQYAAQMWRNEGWGPWTTARHMGLAPARRARRHKRK